MAMKEVDDIYGESIGEISWKKNKQTNKQQQKKTVVLPVPFSEDDSNLSTLMACFVVVAVAVFDVNEF